MDLNDWIVRAGAIHARHAEETTQARRAKVEAYRKNDAELARALERFLDPADRRAAVNTWTRMNGEIGQEYLRAAAPAWHRSQVALDALNDEYAATRQPAASS